MANEYIILMTEEEADKILSEVPADVKKVLAELAKKLSSKSEEKSCDE